MSEVRARSRGRRGENRTGPRPPSAGREKARRHSPQPPQASRLPGKPPPRARISARRASGSPTWRLRCSARWRWRPRRARAASGDDEGLRRCAQRGAGDGRPGSAASWRSSSLAQRPRPWSPSRRRGARRRPRRARPARGGRRRRARDRPSSSASDEDLARSGDPVDGDGAEDQALGAGDVGVAGADDLVDARDARRAVRQRADRLRAAGVDDCRSPPRGGRRRDRVVVSSPASGVARTMSVDAGDARRDRAHQHARRVARLAAGRVDADARRGDGRAGRARSPPRMRKPARAGARGKRAMRVGGELEGFADVGREARERAGAVEAAAEEGVSVRGARSARRSGGPPRRPPRGPRRGFPAPRARRSRESASPAVARSRERLANAGFRRQDGEHRARILL